MKTINNFALFKHCDSKKVEDLETPKDFQKSKFQII